MCPLSTPGELHREDDLDQNCNKKLTLRMQVELYDCNEKLTLQMQVELLVPS